SRHRAGSGFHYPDPDGYDPPQRLADAAGSLSGHRPVNDQLLTGIGMTSQRTRNRLVQRLRDSGIRSQAVLDVIAQTPRHLFVDEALAHRAYEDTALPIGHGQTISQPLTVARMTEVLLRSEERRVGNGCRLRRAAETSEKTGGVYN